MKTMTTRLIALSRVVALVLAAIIAGPAADYNQREARVLLEHPYKR